MADVADYVVSTIGHIIRIFHLQEEATAGSLLLQI